MYKFYVIWTSGAGRTHFHWTYLRSLTDHIDQDGVEYFYEQLRRLARLGSDECVILTWQYIGIWEEEDVHKSTADPTNREDPFPSATVSTIEKTQEKGKARGNLPGDA